MVKPQPPQALATCLTPSSWPNLKDGVACDACTALVLTELYGGRCDRYCESFGHSCTAAAEEVEDNCDVKEAKACGEAIAVTSDMLCTCQQDGAVAQPTPPPGVGQPTATPLTCASRRTWPNLKDGITCEACTALVLTEPYGGRCDKYCESFGHSCVSAAEEVEDNCEVLHSKGCGEAITGTSDMLCTCRGEEGATVPPTSAPTEDKPWRTSSETVGSGWCATKKPAGDWDLFRSCGNEVRVSVLSYNLYWSGLARWGAPERRLRCQGVQSVREPCSIM